MEKIKFAFADGEEAAEFFVLEQTRIAGVDYILVTDSEEDDAECFEPDSGELMLGDIVISADKVLEQSAEYGHSVKREYAFLIAHSMLHLMGYDHMTEEDAAEMEHLQEEILKQLNILR